MDLEEVPSINDYHVGWICAVGIEYTIACALLDHEYPRPPYIPPDDHNSYTFGLIGEHRVVVACLPVGQYGLTSAASLANNIRRTFTLQFGLMVGIGGGAPTKKRDIRLGDVVVSVPGPAHGGVLQYDYGKTIQDREFQQTNVLNAPPTILLTALGTVRQRYDLKGHQLVQIVDHALRKHPRIRNRYKRPTADSDVLYKSSFVHSNGDKDCTELCASQLDQIVSRQPRDLSETDEFIIHYGLIASANQLMKDAFIRDRLAETKGVLCFEMEAAGLMNELPCIVIRGICDYSDTHKNDSWQGFAAAMAAAYAKDLLLTVNPYSQVKLSSTLSFQIAQQATANRSQQESSVGPVYTPDEIACLRSFYFKDMDTRRHNLSRATNGTCMWFFDHPIYNKWAGQGQGLLWIKGRPGAGKSVLLDTVLKTIEGQKATNNTIIASFFFHGRGSALQKSEIGLYRSLMHQILSQCAPLLAEFCRVFVHNSNMKGTIGQDWDWHEKLLFEYLNTAVKKYSRIRPIKIFVDALDECGEETARKLAYDLWCLTIDQADVASAISVCFACRHFPIMDLHGGLEVFVEEQNAGDIISFIQTALTPVFTSFEQRAILENDISIQASGLFLWVVLIVPRVAELGRSGRNFDTIRETIRNTPKDLWLMYEEALSKTRPSDRIRSLRLIQWICLAQRPLSISEMRCILAFDPDNPPTSMKSWTSSSDYLHDIEQVQKQIYALSGGLIEVVEQLEPVLQFIHQSVKDYFLSEGMSKLEQFITGEPNPKSQDITIGYAHAYMSRCCRYYAFTHEIQQTVAYWNLVLHTSPETMQRLACYPFLQYSVISWSYHARNAETNGISQSCILAELTWPSTDLFRHLIALSYLIINDKNLDLGSNLLHVAAYYGLVSVIEAVVANEGKININATNWLGETPLLWAAAKGYQGVAEKLVNLGAHHSSEGHSSRVPLAWAAMYGHSSVVKFLLGRGADVHHTDRLGMQPLAYACGAGDKLSVEMMLNKRANPDIFDNLGRKPL